MSLKAVQAIGSFLRHAREADLPDDELFEAKAHAFDLMAEEYDLEGQLGEADAAQCRSLAAEAPRVGARG